MSNIEQPTDLFVRIKNGKIVEENVLRLHIVNRGHPLHWYTRVLEAVAPELPAFHHLVSSVHLNADGTVTQSHAIVEDPLDSVLRTLGVPSGDFGMELEPKPIGDIAPEVVQYVYKRMGEHFHARLTAFAATREYHSFDSLAGYADSTIPQFAAEAARGKLLRDRVWEALLPYFGEVLAGTKPVPLTVAEIDTLVPAFTWEDAPGEDPLIVAPEEDPEV